MEFEIIKESETRKVAKIRDRRCYFGVAKTKKGFHVWVF